MYIYDDSKYVLEELQVPFKNSMNVEDFTINNEWRLNLIIFDDPLLGDFIANKII